MKVAIVKSSQIDGCWKPARFTGGCKDCSRVHVCKLKEAIQGRIAFKRRSIETIKRTIDVQNTKIVRLMKEIADERAKEEGESSHQQETFEGSSADGSQQAPAGKVFESVDAIDASEGNSRPDPMGS